MKIFTFLKSHTVLLTLIAVLNLVLVYTYVHAVHMSYGGVIPSPRLLSQDTPSYLMTMEYVQNHFVGEEVALPNSTILTRLLTAPFLILGSVGLGVFLGSNALGMLALNIGLYLFSVPVFYTIVQLIYRNNKTAFIGTLLYITNWCLFSYGTTYLSDMGGWFFFLLATMCALYFYRYPDERKWLYFSILATTIGVFFKEYGALGMLSLVALIMIGAQTWENKVRDICIAGFVFGSVLLAYHLWFYFQFQWTYFGWWNHNYDAYAGPASESVTYSLSMLVKTVALIFLPAWPIFLYGAWCEYKESVVQGTERIRILVALLPASLTFLLWPAFNWRIAFILVPWAILITAFGLSYLKQKWTVWVFLLVYILFNYHVDPLMMHITLPF